MANNRMVLRCTHCLPEKGNWTYPSLDRAGQIAYGILPIAKYYPGDWYITAYNPKLRAELCDLIDEFLRTHMHPELDWDADIGPTHITIDYEAWEEELDKEYERDGQ